MNEKQRENQPTNEKLRENPTTKPETSQPPKEKYTPVLSHNRRKTPTNEEETEPIHIKTITNKPISTNLNCALGGSSFNPSDHKATRPIINKFLTAKEKAWMTRTTPAEQEKWYETQVTNQTFNREKMRKECKKENIKTPDEIQLYYDLCTKRRDEKQAKTWR
jgi:hypothetical protein